MDESLKKSEYPSIDFEFDELSTIDDSAFDAIENTLRDASSVGNATQAGLQTAGLQSAIDNYAQAMNQSAIARTTGLPVPEILAPLTIAQKAILVGDPKQLPPVFCSEEIEVIKSIEKCNLQSYLYIDDLFLKSPNTTLLDTQYRMTNRIGDLIGTLFYDGALKNGRNIDGDKDIIWVDYTPTELWPRNEADSEEPQRIFNLDECRIITSILKDLDRSVDNFTSVAVIAPYRHQVAMLRRLLQNEHFNNLDVNADTIDGFQGKECDVVVFSLTRTIGSFRFLADVRRLNVALSRARDKLYIVGNLSYATNHRLLKSIIEHCEKINCDEIRDLTS